MAPSSPLLPIERSSEPTISGAGKRFCRKTSLGTVPACPSPDASLVSMVCAETPTTKKTRDKLKDPLSPSPPKKGRPVGRKSKVTETDDKACTPKKTAKGVKSNDVGARAKVDLITRRVTRQCANSKAATKVFAALRRSVGQALGAMQPLTSLEVETAWRQCQDTFPQDDDQDNASSSDDSAYSSGSEICPGESSPERNVLPCRLKRDAMLLESLLVESDEELSGEEEVDVETDEDAEGFGEELCEEWQALADAVEVDDGYPVEAWQSHMPDKFPGHEGFNKRCVSVMRSLGVAETLHTELPDAGTCPPLQPHQESVAFLLHPKSPVSRLLVDHPTGSGKTWEIIRVLDNYFHDPRPKVPIFPKSPVCRNFYSELLRWPNRYRDYFCCVRPADAAIASGSCDWRSVRMAKWELTHFAEEEMRLLCYAIRDVLELKNMFYMGRLRPGLREEFLEAHPGESMPSGPMRALSYTSAGGSYTNLRQEGDLPRSAMMKIGYTRGCDNVYTNKVVVMDEAHNLVRTQTQYGEQLQCLRDLLVKAKNLVLAGFTGTPILSTPAEGRQLLDIIKGQYAPAGDEGFLSSFPVRPQKLFPVSLPRGIPDAVLTRQLQRQLVVPVKLRGEALRIYDKKRRIGISGRLLSAYCNVCTYFGSFHDGKFGTKEKVLRAPTECCPKLHAIAMEVAAHREKAVVMTSRQCGYCVMLELMKKVASNSEVPFGVATMEELSEFNHVSNLRGERYRVLVADAAQCSEGVSFLAVRRTFLSDVPSSPSQFIQQCGRTIRMFGHQGLPEEEQRVDQHLYVARFPQWMRSPLAMWVFRMFRHVKDGESEHYARQMLAKLQQAGIDSIEDLKMQIDAHGDLKKKTLKRRDDSGKELLNQSDIVMFLELAGLWQEAQPHSTFKGQKGNTNGATASTPNPTGQSGRLAKYAAGSARLKALTAKLNGVGQKKSNSGNASVNFKVVVRSAAKNLPDANRAYKVLSEAAGIVRDACAQIDSFVPREVWQAALEGGLGAMRDHECVAAALWVASPETFKSNTADLKELTVPEVKRLLNQINHAEKAISLSSVLLSVKELIVEIETLQEEQLEHLESKVEERIGSLLQKDQMLAALREVAPDVYLDRQSGGLRRLGVDKVKALRDILEREKNNDKLACSWSPKVLVRAVQELYKATSLDDAVQTLGLKTADEQSIELLAERTQEFAPALAALRAKAIDKELFTRFEVDASNSSECEDDMSEAESAEAVEPCGDAEPRRVNFPEGWKLEWVSQIRGKTREQYRFVDPQGRKYYNVSELRIAIDGGIVAVQAARLARQQTRALEAVDAPAKRTGRQPSSFGGPSFSGGSRKRSRW